MPNIWARGRPLVVQIAKQQTPGTARAVRYDESVDELLVDVDGRWFAAVDAPGESAATKKGDLEKGEDRKDRWR